MAHKSTPFFVEGNLDPVSLALFYHADDDARSLRCQLIEEARQRFAKYDLSVAELEEAAVVYARTVQMLQDRQQPQQEENLTELEHHVLDYCGFERGNPKNGTQPAN